MLERYAFSFYEVVVRIEQLRSKAKIWTSVGSSTARSKADREFSELIATLKEMQVECKKLDLTSTTDLISHIESEVQQKGNDDYTYADMLNHLNTLSFSFTTELRKNCCFRIAKEKDKYFQKDDLFGPEVSKAFGSCVDEIRNAGSCYALEQYEATAFHSMKVLERGLDILAKKFGVDFSYTNWHNVIEQIEKHIKNMNSSFGADWKEQRKFYSQAATHFMFLKDAWRNHVMHIRDVPYDEGRAFSVFSNVREFMQALAEGGLTE
jgi:hypothetical protein